MKRISCLLFAAVAAVLCFTGCQHNIVDDKDSVSYDVFHQLGAKVRVSYPVYKNRFGKQEKIYQEKILFLSELCALSPKEKQKREFLIRELQISKLRLMQFAL